MRRRYQGSFTLSSDDPAGDVVLVLLSDSSIAALLSEEPGEEC